MSAWLAPTKLVRLQTGIARAALRTANVTAACLFFRPDIRCCRIDSTDRQRCLSDITDQPQSGIWPWIGRIQREAELAASSRANYLSSKNNVKLDNDRIYGMRDDAVEDGRLTARRMNMYHVHTYLSLYSGTPAVDNLTFLRFASLPVIGQNTTSRNEKKI